MISKLFNFVLLALFTLFIIWAIGLLWFATSIATVTTDLNKDSIRIEAIVVLTGGNGRINEGLDLLANNTAPKLFISGVHKDVTKKDIIKNWKAPVSPTPCCISLGYQSTDTISNATEVKQWVEDNNISSFILVTSTYHMPRASMEIEKQLPNTRIILHPVVSKDFESWSGRFWKLAFSEYNKTILRWMQTSIN